MDPQFWHERWASGRIGWHRDQINPHLEAHWPRLNLPASARVFVPLCGKSRDLLWLAGEGHRVVGVELSPIAVEAFFDEAGLDPRIQAERGFTRYRAGEVEILCGDFFALDRRTLGPVEAVYDRASLIALPPTMRRDYAAHMTGLLDPGAVALLITLDYPQGQMQGPPFAVGEDELRALYGEAFEIAQLAAPDVLGENPQLRERGLERLREAVYVLRRWAPG